MRAARRPAAVGWCLEREGPRRAGETVLALAEEHRVTVADPATGEVPTHHNEAPDGCQEAAMASGASVLLALAVAGAVLGAGASGASKQSGRRPVW